MKEFKKHDFSFFSSEEELQEALKRKVTSIVFKAVNEDVSADEILRMRLTLLLIDAVSIGIHPTFLAKDRLEMMLNYDTDDFISFLKSGEVEGLTAEKVKGMWKEELKEFEGMTKQEIYDVLSKPQD